MKPTLSLTLFVFGLLIAVYALNPPTTTGQTLIPYTICVEVPSSAVNVGALRKATRTECNPAQAKTNAILAARVNALQALEGTCRSQITREAAQAACAARGLTLVLNQNNGGLGPEARAVPGGAAIDAALADGSNVNARYCVVLRDVPSLFTSTKQSDLICVLNNFKRTIFTARSRARCGVQCM
jgi:hypothetical protein